MSARSSVTVRIPGSTSNCGSGFDTLGLALRIYNRLTLTRLPGGSRPVPVGGGAAAAHVMVDEAATAFFAKTGRVRFGFKYAIAGSVPPGRGLGSSATVRAGTLAGLNALAGAGLSPRQLVEIVTALEGHPDNAAPSILGGFCVARTSPLDGAYLDCVRVAVPAALAFVVVSPQGEIRTEESRGALPRTLPFFDAVKSINAASFLVAALATREYRKLRHAVADFMHEPYRLPGIPGGRQAIDAGVAAGAFTGWLSGSGTSVLCVSKRTKALAVRRAMTAALKQVATGCAGSWVLGADNAGLTLE
jgi:homoserine kinase